MNDRAVGFAPVFTWEVDAPEGEVQWVPALGSPGPPVSVDVAEGPGYVASELVFPGSYGPPEFAGGVHQSFLDALVDIVVDGIGISDATDFRVSWLFGRQGEPFAAPAYSFLWPSATISDILTMGNIEVSEDLADAMGLEESIPTSRFLRSGLTRWYLPALRSTAGYWTPATRYASIVPRQNRNTVIRSAALGTGVSAISWGVREFLEFDLEDIDLARIWDFYRQDSKFNGVTNEPDGHPHNLFERMLEQVDGSQGETQDITVYLWDRISSTTPLRKYAWTDARALEDTSRAVRQSPARDNWRNITFELRDRGPA